LRCRAELDTDWLISGIDEYNSAAEYASDIAAALDGLAGTFRPTINFSPNLPIKPGREPDPSRKRFKRSNSRPRTTPAMRTETKTTSETRRPRMCPTPSTSSH
jgi:hypothetical protein